MPYGGELGLMGENPSKQGTWDIEFRDRTTSAEVQKQQLNHGISRESEENVCTPKLKARAANGAAIQRKHSCAGVNLPALGAWLWSCVACNTPIHLRARDGLASYQTLLIPHYSPVFAAQPAPSSLSTTGPSAVSPAEMTEDHCALKLGVPVPNARPARIAIPSCSLHLVPRQSGRVEACKHIIEYELLLRHASRLGDAGT